MSVIESSSTAVKAHTADILPLGRVMRGAAGLGEQAHTAIKCGWCNSCMRNPGLPLARSALVASRQPSYECLPIQRGSSSHAIR